MVTYAGYLLRFEPPEIVIEEKMRLVDGGTRLQYRHFVSGPGATEEMVRKHYAK
jgi:hypothetical protein